MNRRNVTNADTDEGWSSGPRGRRSFPRPYERTARDRDLYQVAEADGDEALTRDSGTRNDRK